MTILLVALGAAVGAPLRYFVDRAIQASHDSVFPWGTLTVNLVGSLIFGVLVGGAAAGGVPADVVVAAGVGFCGALTTYSAFGYETVRLGKEGTIRHGFLHVVLSVGAGLAAAYLGVAIGTAGWS